MATAEQWEPCESRGSRTVLGEAQGEIPWAYSTISAVEWCVKPDPQGSALLWNELRVKRTSGPASPDVKEMTVPDLGRELRALAAKATDFVILDMPGHSSDMVFEAIKF